MKNLFFFDTETTGLEEGRLLELAMSSGTGVATVRCRPPVPIEIESMAIHHITKQDVEKLSLFVNHVQYHAWKHTFESSICVAHNAPFDIAVLQKESIEITEYIDTKRVCQHLYPEFKEYHLQTIRYYLGAPVRLPCVPHTADCDVRVLMAVFDRLKQKTLETFSLSTDEEAIEKMLELTHEAVPS